MDTINTNDNNDAIILMHDGEQWWYHETTDGRMIPCEQKDCDEHETHVMANSLINAYVQALFNKNRIIASLLLHDADVIMETIDAGMAGEILDEYQRRALE